MMPHVFYPSLSALRKHSGSRDRLPSSRPAWCTEAYIEKKKRKAVLLSLLHPCHVVGNVFVTFITSSFSSSLAFLLFFLTHWNKGHSVKCGYRCGVIQWSMVCRLGVRPLRKTDSPLPCSQTLHGSSLGLRRSSRILAGSLTGLILGKQTEFLNSWVLGHASRKWFLVAGHLLVFSVPPCSPSWRFWGIGDSGCDVDIPFGAKHFIDTCFSHVVDLFLVFWETSDQFSKRLK